MAKPGQRTTEDFTRSSPQRMAMLFLAIVLVLGLRYWSQRNGPAPTADNAPTSDAGAQPQATSDAEIPWAQRPRQKSTTPASSVPPSAAATSTANATNDGDGSQLVIRNVSLRNQDGKVIYRGDIDLRPTLQRIDAGKKLRFSHDGSVFQNREGRLPTHASGYYREWVVPTPGEDGPGPQRIVTGLAGETWYTADHYRTFQRIPRVGRPRDEVKNRRSDE